MHRWMDEKIHSSSEYWARKLGATLPSTCVLGDAVGGAGGGSEGEGRLGSAGGVAASCLDPITMFDCGFN